MTVQSFNGVRKEALFTTSVAALLPNRFINLTKSTMVSAYATYGSDPDGLTTALSVVNGAGTYKTSLELINNLTQSFWVNLLNTVALGGALVCVANGRVAGADHDVTNMHTAAAPSPGANAKYIVPAAGWSGSHGNAVAVYTHVGTSWAYTEMTTDTAGTVVYNASDLRHYVWNGTAWVVAKVVAYAGKAGVATEDIPAFNTKSNNKVTRENSQGNYAIVEFLSSTSESEANAEIVLTDSRILATDKAIPVGLVAQNAVTIKGIVITAGTATITLTGNGGTSTVATIALVRAVS
jgi:hypothetical protein